MSWTEEDDNYLKKWFRKKPARIIAKELGFDNEHYVRRRVRKLSLNKPQKRFTPEEEEIIRKYYPKFNNSYISKMIGVDSMSISNKAKKMGVKKSHEYMSLMNKVNKLGKYHKVIS